MRCELFKYLPCDNINVKTELISIKMELLYCPCTGVDSYRIFDN